ncbi:MAG: F0F1 ATP synthase subunit B [Gemmatimonadetes bacterium]|jgi:F-type H+-transporting ATPase subunit b|nr:F0F1 ATP synthase subunit B [Gemmatimonadota bacterium]
MTSQLLYLIAAAQEEHAAGPASPFEVNFGLFFWTWFVFVALFFALKWFAWPAILRATEERERKIKAQLEDAERMNTEARAALEEHKKLLAGAKGEAHAILNEAKAVAQKEREALLARARQEQDQVLERAKREIGAERERAVRELRREAVDLSLAAASKLVEERLDDDANRRLVTEYLSTLGKGR